MFSEIYNINPKNVEQPAPPDPDIIFYLNDQKIGLEITELFSDNNVSLSGSKLMESESLRYKVLELTIRQIVNYFPFFFGIHVTYSDNNISPHMLSPLAKSLVEILKNELVNIQPTKEWQIIKYQNNNHDINLEKISIYVSTELDKHYYSPIAFDWTPNLKIDNILRAITSKEEKLDKYKISAGQVWLLIVEIGTIASSFYNIDTALSNTYHSRFDKVLLLRNVEKKVYEIFVG